MKKRAIFKILFLLHLIFNKEITKKEIMDEFKVEGIEISPNSITLYIKKLISFGFEIETLKNGDKKENLYKIKKTSSHPLNFSKSTLNILREIKLLVISQKDWRYIEALYNLFSRISEYILDKGQKENFLNFGYFSTLNWELISILKEHCKKKSTLLIDYLLPYGGSKIIEYQAYSLELGDLSQRLYLKGRLRGAKDFFSLPVDRIYRIKKDITSICPKRENVSEEIFEYKISKENQEFVDVKKDEKILKEDEKYITIQAKSTDDFKTIQRLLYFCPDIYYISSKRIKGLLFDSLKKMEKVYE